MYWDPPAPAGDVFSQNGVAHIVSRRSAGYPNRSLSSLGTDSGAPRNSWRQGYFEARFKYTSATGAMPAFWLMAASDPLNPNYPAAPPPCLPVPGTFCPSAELDIFEHFPVNGVGDHEATLHRNTSGRWGMADQTRPIFSHLGYDLGADWHVYSARWTQSSIQYYLDGVSLGSVQTFDTTDQPMFLTFYMWTSVYGPRPDASSPDSLDMQVDWVRVWQR
jgi:beta-glucanase (GH16 family)